MASANIFKIDSIYRWKGEMEEVGEYGLLMKTRGELFSRVEERIKELHPYELPAIVAWTIDEGSREFLDWIGVETSEDGCVEVG